MSKELKENENVRWLLTQIQEISEAIESDEIEYNLDEFSKLDNAPPVSVQRQIIYNLHDKGAVKILKEIHDTYGLNKIRAVSGGFEIEPVGFILEILRTKFEELLKNLGGIKKQNRTIPEIVKIETIKLDIHDCLLRVNDGDVIVNFKSKSRGEGLEKETKQFRILVQLWDFRWEFKKGKVSRKGDIASLQNLRQCCNCPTTDSAYRHTQRLNAIFENHGLAICIVCKNSKCHLEINKQ